MRVKRIQDMSLSELKQKLISEELCDRKIKIIKKRIHYLRRKNYEAIERYRKSPMFKKAFEELRKEGKGKPVYVKGILKGYEYDFGEALLKVVEIVQSNNEKVGNDNAKRRIESNDAECKEVCRMA